MIVKPNHYYVDVKSNNINPNGENIVAINLKLLKFSSRLNFKVFFVRNLAKCLQNMSFCNFHFTYQNGMNKSFLCS